MFALRFVVGLRTLNLETAKGIDIVEHGEGAYALGTGSLRLARRAGNHQSADVA
jgi:hypothetical protein